MASVSSMTGYAVVQQQTCAGLATIELRSVNSRFLDLSFRIQDDLRALEAAVREQISAAVKRGKLECRISVKSSGIASSARLSEQSVQTLAALQSEALKTFPGACEMSVSEILSYPGILVSESADAEQLKADVLAGLGKALEAFSESRLREGAALSKVLLGYCDTIESIARSVEARLPEILNAMKTKLEERMQEALSKTLSENSSLSQDEVNERIRSELTLYALRMDVAEEINRLITHVAEVRRILSAGGPAGRRLDFLMQELNREANTLGSKAVAIEMTSASLDLKLTIEKMREQIQNLE